MNWKCSEKKVPSQWKAQWIGRDDRGMPPFDRSIPFYVADDYNKGENQYYLPPVPYFRKSFVLKKKVKAASVYFSAFGLIRLYLNGLFVGNDLFVPGNMDYPKRVYARGYDVTELLNQLLSEADPVAEIVLGAELSDGWYAGYMGLNNRQWYGNKPRLMVQLELEYEDGTTEIIVSDESWRSELGMIREADLFEGECWDANLEIEGWKEPGFDDTSWRGVDLGCEYPLLPQAHPGDPVVIHGEVQPKALRQTAEDTYMADFDSYICGILRVKVRGEKGSIRFLI